MRTGSRCAAPRTVLASALMLVAAGAFAQDAAQGIRAGEGEVFPTLRLSYFNESNTFLTADDEVASSGFSISPSVVYRAERRALGFSAGYSGSYAFHDEDVLDYDDHRLFADTFAEWNSRLRTNAGVSLARQHERLGERVERGDATGLDQVYTINRYEIGGGVNYGASGARGNVGGGLSIVRRDYTNNESITDGTSFTRVTPSVNFSMRLTPSARGVLELRYLDYAYEASGLDRSELQTLIGADWAPGGAFSGSVRVGATTTEFDAGGDDESTAVADVALRYERAAFNRFSLVYSRAFDTLALGLDAVTALSVEDNVGIGWEYDYSSRFSHRLSAGLRRNERACPDRDTSTVSGGLEIDYRWRRWLALGVSGNVSARSGSDCPEESADDLDYESNSFGVFIRATL